MNKFNPSITPLRSWVGDDPVVWVIESEVERHWQSPNPSAILGPAIASRDERLIVSAMDELALLVSCPQDIVVLRRKPDDSFLEYLQSYGLGQGHISVLSQDDPNVDISELVFNDHKTLDTIREARKQSPKISFQFFGSTRASDLLVEKSGIPSLSAASQVTQFVNDKCYAAKLEGNFSKIPSKIACSISDLESMAKEMLAQVNNSSCGKIVLKEPMGVSGKGIKIISSVEELEKYLDYLRRRSMTPNKLLIEKYIEKQGDVNYQFYVSPSGDVAYYTYKEALLDGHKHLGHFTTAIKSESKDKVFSETAMVLGRNLAESGYYGVVGVDGIIDKNEQVYPLLEINARLNNSSFQWVLDQFKINTSCMLTSQMSFVMKSYRSFVNFRNDVLGKMGCKSNEDIFVMNWSAINRIEKTPSSARLMYAIFANARDRCLELHDDFERYVAEYFSK